MALRWGFAPEMLPERLFHRSSALSTPASARRRMARWFACGLALLALPAQAAVTVNKTFTPASMTVNGTSTITITLGNTGTVAATGAAFTDNLPAGVQVANPSNAATTCGGTVAATAGASSFSLSGGSIPANGGTCTVTVSVTASALGSYTNTIPVGGVTSSQGSNAAAASASLAVVATRPVTGTVTYAPAGAVLRGNGPPVTVTITLNNPNTLALTNASTTFNLQTPFQAFASTPNLSSTCGPVTLNPATGTGTLSGGTIPANGSCTITFDIVGTPNTPANGSTAVTIAAGNLTTAQAITNSAISGSINTHAGGVVAKSFSPTSVPNGGTSTLTLRLTNRNATAITPVDFTDTLPAGMTVAPTPNLTNTCGGTATAAAGSSSIQLSGGTVAGGTGTTFASCTITVSVVAVNTGATNITLTNTIPAGDWNGVGYPAANASLVVIPPGRVVKSFSPTTIPEGGTSTLTLRLENYSAAAVSPVNLVDPLPAGLTVAAAPNITNTCGGTVTAAAGSDSVQLNGGSLPAAPAPGNNSSCTITVDVTADIAGTYRNTIPAGNWNGLSYPSATADLIVRSLFTASKSWTNTASIHNNAGNVTASIASAGADYTMAIRLTNNTDSPINVTSLTDDLTTMGAGFTVAPTLTPSTTCAGGTVVAPAGGTMITLTGGTIPASGFCTITVAVRVPFNTAALGNHTNTIPAGAIVTNVGSNATPVNSTTLAVVSPLQLFKSFSPTTVNAGTTSTLTITVNSNLAGTGTAVGTLTNISGTDNLPAGMVMATPPALATTCNGTVTAPAGGSTVAFSGVNLMVGTSCTITVDVFVPENTPAGTLSNVIPANSATTDQGMSNSNIWNWYNLLPNNATANLAVVTTGVTIGKSFTPATVGVGTVSQMRLQLVNTNPGNVALSGVALTDPLPTGMAVASPAGASLSGCTGTLTATAGASTVSLSGGSIAANATCTILVNVVGTAAGNLINTIPSGGLTTTQGVTNVGASSATLAVSGSADMSITKTDDTTTVAAGTTTTYTIVVNNAGPDDVVGVVVSDTPPSGMTFTGWTCAASAGASCGAASGSGPINETINIDVGATVTYTVEALVAIDYSGGSITNSATVTPPALVSDPNPDNNTASDTDTVASGVVLALTKDDGSATYTPGGAATYTVTVTNTGAAGATQVNVTDTLPAGVTLSGDVTCTPAGAATCGTVVGGAGQTSFSATGATIPSGAGHLLTFTVPVAFATDLATDPLMNTVTASDVPSGASGSASDSDTLAASADVSIVKSGPASVLPGGTISYTLTISNSGPSAADGASFSDPVDASITGISASCGSASGGAVCPGTVDIAGNTVSGAIPTLPPGGSVVITINGTTSPANGATLVNTAQVAPPAGVDDPDDDNNSSTVETGIQPTIGIQKTVDTAVVVPGGTMQYTITVTNTGPVAADGTLVTDPVPAGIDSQTWTCVPSGGATCTASGNDAINDTIATFPPGSSAVYTVVATVSATPPSSINNTATATPPDGACSPANTPPPCTATASVPPVPQVSLSKTADTGTATPGGTIVYTIVVSNTGVVDADGTPVSDPVPAGIASQTWTCAASGGATCAASGSGAISDTIATFPPGSFVTYTVTAVVDANPPAIVSNTVTVTPPPDAICTPENTPPPCTATADTTSSAQISVTKTADTSTLTPGGTVTYTVTVTNTGTVPADGTTVDDPIPTGISAQTWTCAPNAGATCTADGSGAISDTIATFPPGSFVTYTVTATIAANPPATITNTASATPPPGGICTPGTTPPPCTSSVSGDSLAQILVQKTANPAGALMPGGTVTYRVTVANAGSADAPGTQVSDPLPAGIASATWTCAASGGAACPNASGSGGLNETIATFPSGGSVVYTITATVSGAPPASIENTASVTPPEGVCLPANTPSPCTSTTVNASAPSVFIAKSVADDSGNNVAEAGEQLTYTIVLANGGGSDAVNYGVTDPLDPNVSFVSASDGGTFGGGAVTWSGLTVPAGGSLTLTVVVTVDDPLPIGVAQIVNVAHATGDSPPDCSAVPGPSNCAVIAAAPPAGAPALTITKSANTATLQPGGSVVYTITVRNVGSADASDVVIDDPIPTGISGFAWTCAGTGVACPNANGSGAIAEVVPTLPAGATIVYTVTAVAGPNPPNTIQNIAGVASSGPVTCLPSGLPPPCMAAVAVTVPTGGPITPVPTPATHVWALLLLGLGLLGMARRMQRMV